MSSNHNFRFVTQEDAVRNMCASVDPRPSDCPPALAMIRDMDHPLAKEIAARIRPGAGCLYWKQYGDAKRITKATIGGVKINPRRVIWETLNGPIPHGSRVLAHCRNRMCVNPRHMRLSKPYAHAERILGNDIHDLLRQYSKDNTIGLKIAEDTRKINEHWLHDKVNFVGDVPHMWIKGVGNVNLRRHFKDVEMNGGLPANKNCRSSCGVKGCFFPGHVSVGVQKKSGDIVLDPAVAMANATDGITDSAALRKIEANLASLQSIVQSLGKGIDETNSMLANLTGMLETGAEATDHQSGFVTLGRLSEMNNNG